MLTYHLISIILLLKHKCKTCTWFSASSRFWSLILSVTGEKSSHDEQAACAMLGTQLDDFLHGEPVQHRQLQGHESPEFMGLFPRGVSYKVRNRNSDDVLDAWTEIGDIKKTFFTSAACYIYTLFYRIYYLFINSSPTISLKVTQKCLELIIG